MDIQATRGDHETYDLALTDPTGDPLPLGGASVWFTAKRRPTDADEDAIIDKAIGSGITVIGDPAEGNLRLELEPADTEDLAAGIQTLYYDVQTKDPAGRIATPIRGRLIVASDVRQATI